MWKIIVITSLVFVLSGCTEIEPKPFEPSSGHIDAQQQPAGEIPELVSQAPILPEPAAPVDLEKYTVVVNEVPVKELLFALARDAQINVDIDPAIDGVVTINAVEQTLPQILERIARQVDLRYEFERDNLFIQPDVPFFRTYKVNYTNIARDTSVENTISTEIASAAKGGDTGGSSSSGGDNKSSTKVSSTSTNHFWETLVNNVFSILGENSTGSGQGQVARSTSIMPSPESGLLTVKATASQHEQIQQLIDLSLASARRQVMIQTTIVEVQLNRDYEAGIDWESIDLTSAGFSLAVNALTGGAGIAAGAAGLAVGSISGTTGGVAVYEDADASGRSIHATIQLLDEFGNVRVLSSPQLMALNSHTAVLKVVDNEVYFTVESDVVTSAVGPTTTSQTSTPHVIPVGIFMSITPYIDESDQVILQVRPTISRLFGNGVEDPVNPGNFIPEVQVREMESMLRLSNGQIGVLGGLMQNESRDNNNQIPGTGDVPFFSRAFGSTDKEYSKSELVIFIRPVIVKEPSIAGDLSDYRHYLELPSEFTVPTAGLETK